jgi:phosphocarrier protein FPr
LIKGDWNCNAKSLVSVMGLSLQQGDSVVLAALGADAHEAIEALIPIVSADQEHPAAAPAADAPPAPAKAAPSVTKIETSSGDPDDKSVIRGITASPGVAVGFARRVVRRELRVAAEAESPECEREKLIAAVDEAKNQLRAIGDMTKNQLDAGKAAIFEAHVELLEDPDLMDGANERIARGLSASAAWRDSYKAQAARLASLANELFAARAADLEDVGGRVLSLLAGDAGETPEYAPDSILIAEDLSPSDTATLDRSRVLGFCTVGGGATSHIAILARSLSLPALVGVDRAALDVADGVQVLLDADGGRLRISPDPAEVERVK